MDKDEIYKMIKAHVKGLSKAELECLIVDIEILIKIAKKEKLEDKKE